MQHQTGAGADFKQAQRQSITFCNQQKATNERRRAPNLVGLWRYVEFALDCFFMFCDRRIQFEPGSFNVAIATARRIVGREPRRNVRQREPVRGSHQTQHDRGAKRVFIGRTLT